MSQYRNPQSIKKIIIHCAATPNGFAYTAKDMDDWHKQRGFKRNPDYVENGLYHIGYHTVIELDGNAVNGRGINETGAHCKRHNLRSIGICLIGTDQFTQAQWDTLKHTIQTLQQDYPDIQIKGHNDYDRAKPCPCFDVQQWLDNNMNPIEEQIQ